MLGERRQRISTRFETQPHIGERLLFSFWSEAFFEGVNNTLTAEELSRFNHRLGTMLKRANYPGMVSMTNQALKARFEHLCKAIPSNPPPPLGDTKIDGQKLRIATFTTQDHGGAGLGSQRRVEALRRNGVDAQIYCAFQKTNHDYVHTLPYADPLPANASRDVSWPAWSKNTVLRRTEHPGLKARELFSKTGTIVDFRDIRSVFENTDIVHMHWVSGIFDFDHAEELSDTPVVWTLADMNAFTGGCHYSEGCEGYKNACKNCPLLEKGSDLAHKAWQKKRAAYAKIKNLHIICPSEWLAECARNSSLFGDREVHMIPNAFPVHRFVPTNRLVARQRLGLPLDKKLVLFGADSLNNRRKGGDILAEALGHLNKMGKRKGVEGVFFGSAGLELGIKVHNMGHVSDEEKMSLIYAAADVFAFPSREDNAPLTVAESLLSGTPVVGFPIGNVPEILRHKETGYIAKYEDTEDFAIGLAWALADVNSAQTRQRGLQGYLDARAHNDPETSVKRQVALYRKVLKTAGK